MFKKEIVEKDGEQVFKINGMYFKYDTDKIDDTNPEIQEWLMHFKRFRETHPFYIKKTDDGSCFISEIQFDPDVIPRLTFYEGYWFAYGNITDDDDVYFSADDLENWIDRYENWVFKIDVNTKGDLYVVSGP